MRRLLALLTVVTVTATAPGAGAETLGVTLVSQVNLEADQVGQLLGQVAAAARPSMTDVVVDRRSAVDDGGIGLSCMSEPACLSRQAEEVGADSMLLVSFVKVGASVQVELALVKGASGRIEMRSKAQVSLEDSGGEDLRNAVAMLLAGGRNQQAADPQPSPPSPARDRGLPTSFWVAAGTGGALLVGGTIAAVLAAGKNGAIGDECGDGPVPECSRDRFDDLAGSRDTRALAADILIGTSLVAGGAALVILLADDGGEDAGGVTAVGPGPGVGLGLKGRF